MTPKTLQQAIEFFADPDRCHSYIVEQRWPTGVACPACGRTDVRYLANQKRWECRAKHPKKQFSVKVGTIMEDSAIPLKSWLLAMWMVANCKNGVSSYEVARAIGVTQKTAWFVLQRVRLAMQDKSGGKLGGHVEADETFIGGKGRFMHKDRKQRTLQGRKSSPFGKIAVMGLLQRNSPDGPSRVKLATVPNVRRHNLQLEIRKYMETDGDTVLYSDALKSYEPRTPKGWRPSDLYIHKVIDHAEAYVQGAVHTNGMENFWSLLKRMLKGTYVSVEPFHLFRYLDEQAFRFNERKLTDSGRFAATVNGTVGRRLTYTQLTGKDDSAA